MEIHTISYHPPYNHLQIHSPKVGHRFPRLASQHAMVLIDKERLKILTLKMTSFEVLQPKN